MNQEFLIGYVMGLIVGEGCFSGDNKNHPRLSVKQKENREPLEACILLLGGRINGPYKHTGSDGRIRHYDIWSLDGSNLTAPISIIRQHLPSSKKRLQFEEWIKKYNL